MRDIASSEILNPFSGTTKISLWDLTKGLGFLTRARTKGPWLHRDYRDQKFFGLIARGPTDCSNVCKTNCGQIFGIAFISSSFVEFLKTSIHRESTHGKSPEKEEQEGRIV
jgi:hypothetical protein